MCGRYVLIDGKVVFAVSAQMQTWRDEGKVFEFLPKYDARPTNLMPVVAERGQRLGVHLMRWGLVPHWSKDGKSEFSTFNAKAETLHTSKLFSPYFKSARCLIPADGFFEWKKYSVTADVKGKLKAVEKKQKMFIGMKDRRPFFMAGLFSVWKNGAGEEFPTYTIITTSSNALLKEVHDRMPVILDPEQYVPWLDRSVNDLDLLHTFLDPYDPEKMIVYPVTNTSEENPAMIERIEFEIPAPQDVRKLTDPLVVPKRSRTKRS